MGVGCLCRGLQLASRRGGSSVADVPSSSASWQGTGGSRGQSPPAWGPPAGDPLLASPNAGCLGLFTNAPSRKVAVLPQGPRLVTGEGPRSTPEDSGLFSPGPHSWGNQRPLPTLVPRGWASRVLYWNQPQVKW